MADIINIAAYKFAPLNDLKTWREQLLIRCKSWHLKGTILLSTEGINLFVAGAEESITLLLDYLSTIPNLGRLTPKYSRSDHQPFRRMLVRIKKEIISFGVEGIAPEKYTSAKISPRQLKQWLDEGRPITLLDTRNDYEVKLGTFRAAKDLNITHFRQFPAAVRELPPAFKQTPIVMFCTGGIRCEKAGPFMEREGFEQIFQLDGGILKYFEDCGSEHYDGECFVFDQRVGLDPELHETDSAYCFACQASLTAADQQDARFTPGVSCPYCFVPPEEQQRERLREREAAIQRVTSPLPGAEPYDNYRPLTVPARCEGFTLDAFLHDLLPHIGADDWRSTCDAGRLLNDQRQPVSANAIVHAGERYWHWLPGTREPEVNANITLLHEDEALIVINKPAPLPVHPCGRFNRNTVRFILGEVYQPQVPRPVHRLDANTTGVLVLARTRHFTSLLQPKFSRGLVRKTYLALVNGRPPEHRFECRAAIGDVVGELGSRAIDEEQGLASHTEFEVLERFNNGTTLLKAWPRTGRTNQIRLHLAHLGWPIVGDQAYRGGDQLGDVQTHDIHDAPLCLHALEITFEHPLTKRDVTFTAPPPFCSPIAWR